MQISSLLQIRQLTDTHPESIRDHDFELPYDFLPDNKQETLLFLRLPKTNILTKVLYISDINIRTLSLLFFNIKN